MGAFKVYNVADFADKLPQSVVNKGGVFIAMYQREAMWISFSHPTNSRVHPAVKVSVGGVNALTGTAQGMHNEGDQDYLPIHSGGGQLWLDGICTAPGIVRQFVAMQLGHGYTIEGQITGEEEIGGMQIDVFKPYITTALFRCNGKVMNLFNSPAQEGLQPRASLWMQDKAIMSEELNSGDTMTQAILTTSPMIQVKAMTVGDPLLIITFTGNPITIPYESHLLIDDLKKKIHRKEGTAPDDQRLIFEGHLLVDGRLLFDYGIKPGSTIYLLLSQRGGADPDAIAGFAAGGRISQKINRDTLPPLAYDDAAPTRLHITVINAAHFSAMTGLPAPSTPISTSTYLENKLPWFTLYDERVPGAKMNFKANPLPKVKSVAALDAVRGVRRKTTSQRGCAFCVHGKAAFLLHPCSHVVCEDCASGLGSDVCPACPTTVHRRKRLADEEDDPQFGLEAGSYEGRVVHLKRYAKGDKVASFILREHAVSKLSGDGRA
ncbi:uncharacterized protein B0H18DRAFT_458767 [Fomitopsis serialis]|uniref:uncharacterized protein n=1 Tax=Fomitopsis serialis TaxID=139415 RepID=UPI0020082003|nr:uncharacterized protein B0H18DRAFT_458767 [Neoantrodia serialis]KAH9923652.1 hypothetical protein B0H18DRAFT_458767 [Neoantrodia serialis]